MSIIPAFELGLWNAWIFFPPMFLILIISDCILKKRGPEFPQQSEKEKKLSRTISILFLLAIFYSIFLPLRLDTAWFYVGFSAYLLGAIFYIVANLAFVASRVDEPVTKGVYSFSRHPMNFGMFIIWIGISIACLSWVYLLLSIVFIILMHFWLSYEESFLLKKYGAAYGEYMNRTPRWIGIPKSEKSR